MKSRLESFMKRMQLCDQSQSATGTFYKLIHYFNQTELVCKDGCKYGETKMLVVSEEAGKLSDAVISVAEPEQNSIIAGI